MIAYHSLADTEGVSALEPLQKAVLAGAPVLPTFFLRQEWFERLASQKDVKAAAPRNGLSEASLAKQAKAVIQALRKQIMAKDAAKELERLWQEASGLAIRADGAVSLRLAELGEEANALTVQVANAKELGQALVALYSLRLQQPRLGWHYRNHKALPGFRPVIVQLWPEVQVSGSAASFDRETGDETVVDVRAWHLENPRHYVEEGEDRVRVDRKSLAVLTRSLREHWWARDTQGFKAVQASAAAGGVISDDEAIRIARLVKNLATAAEERVEAAWIKGAGQYWLTNARYVAEGAPTVQGDTGQRQGGLIRGEGVHGGVASGPIRLVRRAADCRNVQAGEVAVMHRLTEKMAQDLGRAAAIIAETAIDSDLLDLLDLPAVAKAGQALHAAQAGQVVTVDGNLGEVTPGRISPNHGEADDACPIQRSGTKVWLAVDDPHLIKAGSCGDGVGLLRGEFILRSLGLHPHDVLRSKFVEEYRQLLREGIVAATRKVAPYPVLYQLHDIASLDLFGVPGRHRERHEPNPLLGYRGAHRLLAEPDILELELSAILAAQDDGAKVGIVIPMARSVEEVEALIRRIGACLGGHQAMPPIWVRCEVPALLIRIADLCELPIAGVSFDVENLAQLLQGIDKENGQMASRLATTDPAVLEALSYAVSECYDQGVETMILSPDNRPDPALIEEMVRMGVSGVCVDEQWLAHVRPLLLSIEQRLLLEHAVNEQRD